MTFGRYLADRSPLTSGSWKCLHIIKKVENTNGHQEREYVDDFPTYGKEGNIIHMATCHMQKTNKEIQNQITDLLLFLKE